MNQIKCVVVDDEYLAIEVIKTFISKDDELHLAKTFVNTLEALEYVKNNEVDLIFLDIHLPFLTGLEFKSHLSAKTLVIFTTANPDYALQAYEAEAIDYLLKPISKERFDVAVIKAKKWFWINKTTQTLDKLSHNKMIEIKSGYKNQLINSSDILYVESLGEYIKIHTGKEIFLMLGALKTFLESLPSEMFVRIHKSYIVSLDSIKSFNISVVLLHNGLSLPIGRKFKEDFRQFMASKSISAHQSIE
jgi:DNA-binding LytR/AlgR family response regulator